MALISEESRRHARAKEAKDAIERLIKEAHTGPARERRRPFLVDDILDELVSRGWKPPA